jgi:hypothetical protein
MIIEKMARRFKQFMSLLDDEPSFDSAIALFREGRTINEVVSRLAPTLGGPALVAGQQLVQEQIRRGIDKQAAVIREQYETIEKLQDYAARLERENAMLRRALAQRAAAE